MVPFKRRMDARFFWVVCDMAADENTNLPRLKPQVFFLKPNNFALLSAAFYKRSHSFTT